MVMEFAAHVEGFCDGGFLLGEYGLMITNNASAFFLADWFSLSFSVFSLSLSLSLSLSSCACPCQSVFPF
jgi:hypothetical protein